MNIEKILVEEFQMKPAYIRNIMNLINAGNTIPFIARYRKELIGSCDDQVLRDISDRIGYLENLNQRMQEVLTSIDEQGKLTIELKKAIQSSATLAELEDLYRPYRQKRRTRATIARERGLGPLADILYIQDVDSMEQAAAPFINPAKDVPDSKAALAGAMDIVAEILSDDAKLRVRLRELIQSSAIVESRAAKKNEDSVYRTYYDFSQPVPKLPPHRVLAIDRGEKTGYLKVAIRLDDNRAFAVMENHVLKKDTATEPIMREIIKDAWQRLLFPSLEREVRANLTMNAQEQAIRMFGQNLKSALLQPPLRGKVVMGFDPAYRTGCKLAIVDAAGKVLDTGVIFPTPPKSRVEEAKKAIKELIRKHQVEVIAIGNGTASKESELFVAQVIAELPQPVAYVMVNEAGASVYSASKLAAKEFPEYDVSLRSAISIARRLQDPLAELVKIDPKSIGVGQYQHDMPQKKLNETLKGVVEDCVNSVGVDVNTASPSLLSYVAGLTAAASENIYAYRTKNGAFQTRAQLKKVPKLGPKAYEQCAGFLRISDGKQVLDNTGVHPESYTAVKKLLALFGFTEKDIALGTLNALGIKLAQYGEAEAAEQCGIGIPTLRDIIAELKKPGRDIRDSLPKPVLRQDVMDISDLKPGMEFEGTVRNVIDFGAFVDIGVHQDGLVHISQMTNRYIKHPGEVVQVGDTVRVRVLSVDVEKNRISLSMLGGN